MISGGDLADPAAADLPRSSCEARFRRPGHLRRQRRCVACEEQPLAEVSVERWRSTLRSNLDSVFLSTRAVLPLMRTGGRVVIVSSTAGQRGEAFHADYAASKGALISLTKSLAVEYAPVHGQLRCARMGRHRDERRRLYARESAAD